MHYVAYYCVSTKKRADSGLGLQARQSAVTNFIKGAILARYTEVESGQNDKRQQWQLAIDRAKQEAAILVIAKLDRLSRHAAFFFALRDSGVNFQCVAMPDANTVTVGIFATLAQHERELISQRTKAALAAKRSQGVKLGKPENLTPAAQRKGMAGDIRRAAAKETNRRAMSLIRLMRQAGRNLTQMAAKLNRAGFRTARGGPFQVTQVMRLARCAGRDAPDPES